MRLPAWLTRFGKKTEEPTEEPEPKSLYIYASQSETSVVMITMLGVDPVMIEEIISVTSQKFSGGHRVIYITDSLDFMIFRRHGAMFEYLPPLSEQKLHADAMPWGPYLQARWQLLLAKWKPLHILAYGENIDRYLAAASAASARKAG